MKRKCKRERKEIENNRCLSQRGSVGNYTQTPLCRIHKPASIPQDNSAKHSACMPSSTFLSPPNCHPVGLHEGWECLALDFLGRVVCQTVIMQLGRQGAGQAWLLCGHVFCSVWAPEDIHKREDIEVSDRVIVLSACNCNPLGSLPPSACDVDTGQCLCRPFATGPRCEECAVRICLRFSL